MSVYKERAGWKVRYRIGQKQHSKSGFKTKREAEAYEAEQLRRIRNQTWTDPRAAKAPLDDVFEAWLAASRRADRTNYDYRQLWESRISPRWGGRQVGSIVPTEVAGWISELQVSLSAATVKKLVTVLSQVFDWAVADRRIDSNPVKRAREFSAGPLVRNRTIQKDHRRLNNSEVRQLAEVVDPQYKDFILLLAFTGMRFGEATALQIQDVNLLRSRIHVRRAWSNIAGRLVESAPKTSQSREIPIPVFLKSLLESRLCLAKSQSELVFATKSGAPIRIERFRRDVLKPALRKLGIKDFRVHDFRHTYAGLAIQAGTNPKVLQKSMGHSDIRLTMDTYGGIFDEDLDALSKSLDLSFMKTVK